ncbi:hypothetical protein Tco_0844321, partial [Tanacetum coccineum]
ASEGWHSDFHQYYCSCAIGLYAFTQTYVRLFHQAITLRVFEKNEVLGYVQLLAPCFEWVVTELLPIVRNDFSYNWRCLHPLCEVVYGIIRNLTLPAASRNGPQMSIPHLWNGDGGMIGFSFALGRLGTGMFT